MKLGSEVAQLTAGIDQLYRRATGAGGFLNEEGLIPVAVAPVEPLLLTNFDDAQDQIAGIASRIEAEAQNAHRRDYLTELLDSLHVLVSTFKGEQVPFRERLKRQLRVDTCVVGEDVLDGYRAQIRDSLDACGFTGGSLETDVVRWETANTVPKHNVLATLNDFSRQAQRRVRAHMFDDMDGEWLEAVGIKDVPFNAYCDYPGRKLLLNLDLPYSRYMLKHLACHEAFPGHLVHLALRERFVDEGVMPLDGAQVVTSSASSALFEGIADNGVYFLDWIETPDDETGVVLNRLRAALRCNAAWMMHAEGKSIDEIAPVIAATGYQDVDKVRALLAFLQHDLRAPFVYAYWCGEVAVNAMWSTVPKDRRQEFWSYLYGHMHTPATLKAHWQI